MTCPEIYLYYDLMVKISDPYIWPGINSLTGTKSRFSIHQPTEAPLKNPSITSRISG
jgi:hypothetical protein